MKEITELTIVRSEWRRGKDDENYLLRKDGKKCCLGFFCLAAGASEASIMGRATPAQYDRDCEAEAPLGEVPQLMQNGCNTIKTQELMIANDSHLLDEAEREKRVAELMLDLSPPVKVTFVD